jgi:hypothetical protein
MSGHEVRSVIPHHDVEIHVFRLNKFHLIKNNFL